jgi:hypothetical protein
MPTAATGSWSISRIVILGVAILELAQWLFSLLAVFVQPLSQIPTSGIPALVLLLGLVIYPILAAWGAWLAIKGQQLGRAALLVAVQPVVSVLIMVAFALSVTMHGF